MPRRTARRTRSPHPGVVLVSRDLKTGTSWRARYRDPETNRWSWETLNGVSLTTPEARTEWAKKKSEALAKRRAEIASGAPLDARTPLADAVREYFDAARNRLRPVTVECYRVSVGKFVEWAMSRGIEHTGQIVPTKLAQFRQDLIARKKYTPKTGANAGQGTRVPTDGRVSPATINHHLRGVAAFLNDARKLGRMPFLHRDSIAESLACLPMDRPTPEPLRAQECRGLLEAAIRHDRKTWALTREEHRAAPAATDVNKTPRYRPVAPLVAFVLLSGCRIGEARNLRWDSVDLDALDDHGTPVGEVLLAPSATKTKTARRVDLSVSPRLRAILAAMKLRAGGEPFVFGGAAPLSEDDVKNAAVRLLKTFGAPSFSWQRLRQTCATFLTNAPGIFRAASVWRSAAQLGHAADVAQRHYLGVLRGIPEDARTLDAAMGVDEVLAEIVERARGVQTAADAASARAVAPAALAS